MSFFYDIFQIKKLLKIQLLYNEEDNSFYSL